MTREASLEASHRKRALGLGWLVEKIMQTGRRGFPDRFYARGGSDICPCCKRGRIVLIEWKRPGNVPSAIQKLRIAELRAHGVEVHVTDSLEEADAILGG